MLRIVGIATFGYVLPEFRRSDFFLRLVLEDYFGGYPGSYVEVGETEPVYVDVDKFEYYYKCKHCGHQWAEIKEKEDERKD